MNSAHVYLFVIFITSAIFTILVVGRLVKKAPELGLMDIPNERSSHTRATPRGGGIGVVLTVSFGFLALRCFDLVHFTWAEMGVVLCAYGAIAAVSLWDDFHSVRPAVRFGVHVVASAIVLYTFREISDTQIGGRIALGYWSFPVALIWLVGLTNAYNFMDGSDGIAGVQGTVAGVAWCLFGIFNQIEAVAVLGALIAGTCVGFLRYNWAPAKIFMGDVGSASLGFLLAMLPILAISKNAAGGALPDASQHALVLGVMTVWPFVADASVTFFKRLLKKEPVWKPHRTHYYQLLIQCGWKHPAVALYYGIWATLNAAVGLVGCSKLGGVMAAFPMFAFLVTTHILLRRLRTQMR